MKRGLPAPTMRLLRRETRIFMPTFVKKLVRTIREIAPRERGNGINHLPKFGFRLLDLLKGISEGFLRLLAFNCDERDTTARGRGRLHQSKVLSRRHARLARIHGKGPEDLIIPRHYRLGPPRPYRIPKSKVTVFLPPNGFGSNILHNDSRLQESGSAAQTRVCSHRQWCNRAN